MKKVFNIVSSMRTTAILLLIFAVAIGVATFIENDYGTETALAEVYRADWFEMLLTLVSLNLLLSFFRFKMYQFKKWYVSIFHLSFLIVMVGAYFTRYYGFEGTMHIREGGSSDYILSEKSYIDIEVDGKVVSTTPQLFSNYSENSFQFTNGEVEVSLKEYIPYASYKTFKSDEYDQGKSKLSMIVAIDENLDPVTIELYQGEYYDLGFYIINFESEYIKNRERNSTVINITRVDTELKISADGEITGFSMDTQEEFSVMEDRAYGDVEKRVLYKFGDISFVFKDYELGFYEQLVSNMDKPKNVREKLKSAFIFDVKVGDSFDEVTLFGRSGAYGEKVATEVGERNISISYGSKPITLPFSIYLRDFQLERYAGSMSPSSYASEITLQDPQNGVNMDYRIFMNHVLDYKGYRFFQSSYDGDEMGTILSVNYDWLGTSITYIGYILMFLGMGVAFFGAKSRFQKLRRDLTKISALFILALAPLSTEVKAEKIEIEPIENIFKFDKSHADNFGGLLVQDSGGRMKPLDSLNMEIVNKLHRSSSVAGLNHNQVILGMVLKPTLWKQINMIYTNDEKVNEIIGVDKAQKHVSFESFFDDPQNLGGYKLTPYINEASRVEPKKRGKFEKAIIKIDERVNIAYMVYSGTLLRIYPKPNDSNSKWVGTVEALQTFDANISNEVRVATIGYFQAVDLSLQNGDWSYADKGLIGISNFQKRYGGDIYLDDMKIAGEVLYNRVQIFQKLIPYTLIAGLLLLLIGFIRLLKGDGGFRKTILILKSGITVIFALYTAGLVLRWYISGHAPWSDAYESLIYIGWATLFAGYIFSKSSPFILGSTTVLAGITLFVANLNWLDPQITNLVPVLKSYWLTIHVSLITASYGFLGLGAVLGFITLLLFAIKSESNRDRFETRIKELTIVNEMNLIIGLLMLTVGNFLGGVWANESWGRYWGWDPKETWALVTILIYTVVIHLRFIPRFNSNYAFALASLLAFTSVLMTYFGVNFYLSGMHSYASGDPVPIPEFVYYIVGVTGAVSILAYRKRDVRL